jgi:hypothetical protein
VLPPPSNDFKEVFIKEVDSLLLSLYYGGEEEKWNGFVILLAIIHDLICMDDDKKIGLTEKGLERVCGIANGSNLQL